MNENRRPKIRRVDLEDTKHTEKKCNKNNNNNSKRRQKKKKKKPVNKPIPTAKQKPKK